jgi:cell shape-determining protein MreC
MEEIYRLLDQNQQLKAQNEKQRNESKELQKVKDLNRDQSKALNELRKLLDSTLKVKIKYEKIISKLVSSESLRDSTIEVIREVQKEIQ